MEPFGGLLLPEIVQSGTSKLRLREINVVFVTAGGEENVFGSSSTFHFVASLQNKNFLPMTSSSKLSQRSFFFFGVPQ